ncbi:MAG: YjjG family noncanonical pyrimidine nucleotidase [Oscillospiraceae bacterium]|nr:YjjG family noncanonical pyrimidine nucleotidase [Oscillospiraceae bacterium]
MKNMTISRASEACGGKIYNSDGSAALGRVVIDSRAIEQGDLFVAYKGERVDGHDYVNAAYEKGAACCLVERLIDVPVAQLVVEDVQTALEAIIREMRKDVEIPLIGITGSVGKTSAKEMIWSVLSQRMNVHKTDKNLNNQIGVPMTMSRIEPKHQAAVVEMGISDFGDMTVLAQMVKPQIAVFTVIGHAPLEFLHDLKGVLQAKTEMLDYLDDDALVILNGDDDMLNTVSCRQRILKFGLSDNCDIRAENITVNENGESCCKIVYGERSIDVVVPAFGQHMIYAALEGAAVGFEMGLSDEEIVAGIAAYETVGRRAALVDTGFVSLVDDCYNANPDSVKSGIDSLCKMDGRKVCILGDMLELGQGEGEMHFDCGKYALDKGVSLVLCSGPLSKETVRGAGERGLWFESRAELIEALPKLIQKGDAVLVKASRSMKFEEISEAVKKLFKPVVILDADDTVLDFHASEAVAIRKAFEMMGIEPSDALISRYSEINKNMWQRLELGEITRQQVLEMRFEQLFNEIGFEFSPYEAQLIYENQLAQSAFYMKDAEKVLDILKKKYRLFIASNGLAKVQDGRFAIVGLAQHFEDVFISQKIGYNKPAREFFDLCFEKIPMFSKDKCIMVGDSLSADIKGAINAGIKSCWLYPGEEGERNGIRPDHHIRELVELPGLLEEIFSE